VRFGLSPLNCVVGRMNFLVRKFDLIKQLKLMDITKKVNFQDSM